MPEEEKDEHGCLVGKEKWDEEQKKCVAVTSNQNTEELLKDIKNPAVKSFINSVLAEIPTLKAQLGEKDLLIIDLTKQLDEANKILDGQERAKLINEIIPVSQYKLNDLVDRSIEELKGIRTTLANAMPPKVNSVAFGVLGKNAADDRLKGLTVGDLSVVTAAKRKGA